MTTDLDALIERLLRDPISEDEFKRLFWEAVERHRAQDVQMNPDPSSERLEEVTSPPEYPARQPRRWWRAAGHFIVQWSNPVAALVALVTLVTVLIQLQIMNQQTRMMDQQTKLAQQQSELAKQQTALAQKQDEIIQSQLAKAPNLQVLARVEGTSITFVVNNFGTKGLRDFYWHLQIPEPLTGKHRLTMGRIEQDLTSRIAEGSVARIYYRGFVSTPVFPDTTSELGKVQIDAAAPAGEHLILWWLSTEDGRFPPNASGQPQRGAITIMRQ